MILYILRFRGPAENPLIAIMLTSPVRINRLNFFGQRISCLDMAKNVSVLYFKTSPEIIHLAIMLYVRFPLSLRVAGELIHERGVDVSYEPVRYW